MRLSLTCPQIALTLALALLLPVSGPAQAQEEDGDGGNRRSSQFNVPDGATSEDNRTLQRILERFPESDTDGDGVLTAEEGRTFIDERTRQWEEQRRRGRDRGNRRGRGASHRDLAYGDDERQRIDLYLARTTEERPGPRPLVVYFHAGNFHTGDKRDIDVDARELIEAGVSFATVGYRLTGEHPFPACFEDAARAVQFLRLNAEQYNIDPERIAAVGMDAGGSLALYLALHDDLRQRPSDRERRERDDRDPELDPYDEVGLMMQSTRIRGAVARNALASFDPRFWEENDLPLNGHERYLPEWLAADSLKPLRDREVIAIVEDVSPAALVSDDDPPLLLLSSFTDTPIDADSSWTIMKIHPRQSMLLAGLLRSAGGEATVRYRDMPNDPGVSTNDFLLGVLGVEAEE